jgi:hypothetical protein
MAEVPALDRPNIITRMTAPAGGMLRPSLEASFTKVPSAFGTDSQHKKSGIVPIKSMADFRTTSRSKRNGPSSGGDRGRGARD